MTLSRFDDIADFLFLAFGNSPNTKFLSSSYLDSDSKRVNVHPSFLTQSNPHVFAIGDITSVPESKLYANAKNHGGIVAQNIVSLIKGKDATSLKEYKPGAAMMAVSVGSGGAGQAFGFHLGVSAVVNILESRRSQKLISSYYCVYSRGCSGWPSQEPSLFPSSNSSIK